MVLCGMNYSFNKYYQNFVYHGRNIILPDMKNYNKMIVLLNFF